MFEFLKPHKDVVDPRTRNEFMELLKVLSVSAVSIGIALFFVNEFASSVFFLFTGVVFLVGMILQKDAKISELEARVIADRIAREKAEAEAAAESTKKPVRRARK